MANIDYYRNLIDKANSEITACRELISKINSLDTNIENCASCLNNAACSVATGLITNGAPADNGKIDEIASTLRIMANNVSENVSYINNRISVQYTVEDAERELKVFELTHGNSKKDVEGRKELMKKFKINREDLDN